MHLSTYKVYASQYKLFHFEFHQELFACSNLLSGEIKRSNSIGWTFQCLIPIHTICDFLCVWPHWILKKIYTPESSLSQKAGLIHDSNVVQNRENVCYVFHVTQN